MPNELVPVEAYVRRFYFSVCSNRKSALTFLLYSVSPLNFRHRALTLGASAHKSFNLFGYPEVCDLPFGKSS